MPEFDVGDIVEWIGAPVICLSTPIDKGKGNHTGMAAYLRRPTTNDSAVQVGHTRAFNFGPGPNGRAQKHLWTKPLSDDEEVLAMKLLLLSRGPQ